MENSLSCIEKGIDARADMIEIDVHLTADHQVIVCHDATIDRTTNGSGNIADMTLEQIRQYRLLTSEGEPSEETIPTLDEVLDLCKDRCPVLLEIKRFKSVTDNDLEQLCCDIVREHNMEKQVVYQSFNEQSLIAVHTIDPSARIELLLGKPFEQEFATEKEFEQFLNDKFGYIASLNVHYSMATAEYISLVHKVGREIKIWTLNDPEKAPEGVDGIITNSPDLFK